MEIDPSVWHFNEKINDLDTQQERAKHFAIVKRIAESFLKTYMKNCRKIHVNCLVEKFNSK